MMCEWSSITLYRNRWNSFIKRVDVQDVMVRSYVQTFLFIECKGKQSRSLVYYADRDRDLALFLAKKPNPKYSV